MLYWARNQCERNAKPLSKLFDGGGAQTLNHKNWLICNIKSTLTHYAACVRAWGRRGGGKGEAADSRSETLRRSTTSEAGTKDQDTVWDIEKEDTDRRYRYTAQHRFTSSLSYRYTAINSVRWCGLAKGQGEEWWGEGRGEQTKSNINAIKWKTR